METSTQRVSPLRQRMLEDMRMGHKKLETTALYTQVATEVLKEVISPLETLQPK